MCGWRTCTYYTLGGFLLEAKAIWEHTCIAGGLFLSPIQLNLKKPHDEAFLIWRKDELQNT